MTELEKILSDSLQELSLQYKEDMQRLEAQTSSLQEQVQGLQQQVQASQLATAQQIRDLLQQIGSLAALIEQLE